MARLVGVLAAGEPSIGVQHLPEDLQGQPVAAPRSLSEATHDVIERALLAHEGNVSAAAKALGISRTTMYKRLGSR
ncbi:MULTISPECIES: helix-turn-helix domain-containing protein [Pseudomonas]|uniref:helix-turn-helix domain-containing protein n=1 Tax=Pseudomonas TaxID=286 RepID=UPI00210DAAC9|nr:MULTISPECIES: helix-turn-helix domain-containing protein [Pseudomonas]MDH0024644.1 helix-turn-helix domain-containing protein [Pseudomonas monteilii]